MAALSPQVIYTLADLSQRILAEGEGVVAQLCQDACVLVIRPGPVSDDDAPSGAAETAAFRLNPQPNLDQTQSGEGASPWAGMVQGDGLVVPLVKSDRNPFFGVVAVGRGKTSDVQLLSREVSKHHALFRPSADGWLLQDANSRNGTFVNHLRLTPKEDVRLYPGDQVRFGDIRGMFLDQVQLIAMCGLVRSLEEGV
jgi:hypothetical protein